MIRCVEFEYFSSGRPDHVAFFDTVTDRFVEFAGEQAWSSKKDFEACVVMHTIDPDFVKRLLALAPIWFLDNHEEQLNKEETT